MKPWLPVLPLLFAAACGGSGGSGSAGSAVSGAATSKASVPSPAATAAPAGSSAPAGSAASATSPSRVGTQAPVAPESRPPGDISDSVAYVPYSSAIGRYLITHPEGWSESAHGGTVTFTDKLNGLQVVPGKATAAPTVSTATTQDVPALKSSQPAFELRSVTAVTLPAGRGVRIVYRRNSAPDAVTGRQYRDEVERYEVVSAGREVIVELFGPVGSDNVDPYRIMIQSLRLG